MNKPLAFLLILAFPFLFIGSVYGEELEVKKTYGDNGKLKVETDFKKGIKVGLENPLYEWFEVK
jgi:hypothetical protein